MLDAAKMIARFDALDRAVVAAGFPATSPWWRAQIVRFYTSARRTLVLRVGRRGGKSSTLCRLAVLEMLYGNHAIPPGDVGIAGIVSVSRDEANQRLRTVRAILDALSVKHKPIEGGLELVGRAVVCKVFAATIGGVVGGTWIVALLDEVARWKDSDSGVNPASEVLGSLRPTMATQPNAKMFLSSSPLGTEDAHAKAFDLGDTDRQRVAMAPSWVANPTLSEAETRADEPDERVWLREYAAVPSGSRSSAFSPDAIEAAFRAAPSRLQRIGAPVIALDPSGRGADAFAFCSAGWCAPQPRDEEMYIVREDMSDRASGLFAFELDLAGRKLPNPAYQAPESALLFDDFNVIDASYRVSGAMSAERIYGEIADLAARAGASNVCSDQYDSFSAESWLARHRLRFTSYAWSATSKSTAVSRLRGYLNASRIVFAPGQHRESLRRQLLGFEERVGANGISYGGAARDANGGHFDLVSCLLTSMMADQAGELNGAPATNKISGAVTVLGAGSFTSTF